MRRVKLESKRFGSVFGNITTVRGIFMSGTVLKRLARIRLQLDQINRPTFGMLDQ